MKKINLLNALICCLLVGWISSCANVDEVVNTASTELAGGNYDRALKEVLTLSDSKILKSDSAAYMLATAYYGATAKEDKVVGNEVYQMAFSPDGKMVATVDHAAAEVKVLTYPALEDVSAISTPLKPYCVAISPDGKMIAVGVHDGEIHLYNFPDGDLIRKIKAGNSPVRDLVFRTNDVIISCGNDQNVKAWNVANGNQLWATRVHFKNIKSMSLTSDGKYVVTASNDGTAALVDLDKGEEVRRYRHGENYVNDACASPDMKKVYTVSGDGCLKIYDFTKRNADVTVQFTETLLSVAVSPDSQMIVVGSSGHLYLLTAVSGRLLARIPISGQSAWDVAFVDNSNVAYADVAHLGSVAILTGQALIDAARKLELPIQIDSGAQTLDKQN